MAGAEPPVRLRDVFANLQAWLAEEGRLQQAGEAGLRAAGGAWSVVRRLFGSLLTFGGYLLLVPIYTWFLLFELERISAFVQRYIPHGERERFGRIGSQIAEMLGSFFRGRMLVCLLKGLVLAVVLKLAGFPYALLVGVVSGFLSLVPFVGPACGYGLAFVLGLLEFSLASCAIRIAIVYSIGELMEGYVLLPRVLGDSMGLHPIVVIASLMVFGAALGLFGMLLALPLTSVAVIVARELVLPALAELAEGRGGSGARPLAPAAAQASPGGKPAGE
jgi:predicted PurR-regulated permease PerM